MNAQQISAQFDKCIDNLAVRLKGGYANDRIKRMTMQGRDSVMTPAIARTLAGIPGFDPVAVFPHAANINITKVQRCMQFLNVLVHGDDADGIDAVTLRSLVALREAPGLTLTTDALQLVQLGGRVDPRPSRQGVDAPDTRGISIEKINRLARSTVGVGSTSSMTSRSFGGAKQGYEGDGFVVGLKMVKTDGIVNRAVTLLPENPFSRLFFARVDKLTDAQILRIVSKKQKGD